MNATSILQQIDSAINAIEVKPKILRVLSPTQQTALYFYGLGLNVFPRVLGVKGSKMPWKTLQSTRLYHNPDDPQKGDMLDVLAGVCNLGLRCGRTSRNLFVFDCESRDAFVHLFKQLRERKPNLWAVKSPSKKNGGHIYFLCEDGEVSSIPIGKFKELEIRASGSYVLTVGSRHSDPADPDYPLYDWFCHEGQDVPSVTLSELDGLTDLDGKPITLELIRRRERPPKPFIPHNKRTADYLQYGGGTPEGRRQAELYAAACDYARCQNSGYEGYSSTEAYNDLAPIARMSGLLEAEIDRQIDRAYDRTTEGTFKSKGGKKPLLHWQYAEAFGKRHTWTGRTAGTDRAVYVAFVARCRLGGNENGTFRASEREICQLAHINSRNTVRAAIERFKKADPPIICYAGKDGTSNQYRKRANLWRFSDYVIGHGRRLTKTDPLLLNPCVLLRNGSVSASSDFLERGAVGVIGYAIYKALLSFDQPATLQQIAERANVTAKQVRYHLIGDGKYGGKLSQAGLIIRHGKRHYSAIAATDEDLEIYVSAPAGVVGKSAKRSERFQRERALFAGGQILRWRMENDPNFTADYRSV